MPVRDLSHTTKTRPDNPRGRIRIQLESPPKNQRGVRDWPVFGRKFWSDIWFWYVADREFWSNVFMWVSLAGVATTFGGLIVCAIQASPFGINEVGTWLRYMLLGGTAAMAAGGILACCLNE